MHASKWVKGLMFLVMIPALSGCLESGDDDETTDDTNSAATDPGTGGGTPPPSDPPPSDPPPSDPPPSDPPPSDPPPPTPPPSDPPAPTPPPSDPPPPTPPPPTPPPSDPPPSDPPPTGTGEVQFQNVTGSALVGTTCDAYNPFDFEFMDANGDGHLDVFAFSHEGVDHCLYVQQADGSGTFRYVRGDSGNANYAQGGTPRGSSRPMFVDLNGDGKEDMTSVEADITAAFWLNETASSSSSPRYGSKAAWCGTGDACTVGDINGDGLMDKIHEDRSVETFTTDAEIYPASGRRAGFGWHVIDIDGNSWPDLVDVSTNGYWRNTAGNLSWVDVSGFSACSGTTHQDYADFDNDGDLDIACASGGAQTKNNGGSRHLLRNNGDGTFTNVTSGSGFDELGWQPYYASYSNSYAADFDNDGLIDYVMAGSSYREGAEILQNRGGLRFAKLTDVDINSQCSNGGCKPRIDVGDYDHDGRMDLVKAATGSDSQSIEIYRNTSPSNNRWLKIRLRGRDHNTDGLNASVRIFKAGTSELIGFQQTGVHFNGRARHLHFGLADTTAVDVEITWPHDDGVERIDNITADQELVVTYRSTSGAQVRTGWKPGAGW